MGWDGEGVAWVVNEVSGRSVDFIVPRVSRIQGDHSSGNAARGTSSLTAVRGGGGDWSGARQQLDVRSEELSE